MRRPFALLTFAALAAAAPALADASLTAPLGQTVRIPIRGAASDVVVGDTKIADVTVVSPNALFVSGRGYGSTNVVVMDSGGRTLFNGRVMVPMPSAGQVTLYKGSEQSSVLCAPTCSPPISSDGKGGKGGSLADMISGMMNNAGSAGGPAPAPLAK